MRSSPLQARGSPGEASLWPRREIDPVSASRELAWPSVGHSHSRCRRLCSAVAWPIRAGGICVHLARSPSAQNPHPPGHFPEYPSSVDHRVPSELATPGGTSWIPNPRSHRCHSPVACCPFGSHPRSSGKSAAGPRRGLSRGIYKAVLMAYKGFPKDVSQKAGEMLRQNHRDRVAVMRRTARPTS